VQIKAANQSLSTSAEVAQSSARANSQLVKYVHGLAPTYQSRQKDMSVNTEFRDRIMRCQSPWIPKLYRLSVSGISDPDDGTTQMNARPIHILGSSF